VTRRSVYAVLVLNRHWHPRSRHSLTFRGTHVHHLRNLDQ
jgi:hypothetical protein